MSSFGASSLINGLHCLWLALTNWTAMLSSSDVRAPGDWDTYCLVGRNFFCIEFALVGFVDSGVLLID